MAQGLNRSVRLGLACIAMLPLAFLAACGGKKSSTTTSSTVAITISPTSASLVGNQTQQFTATVTGNSNTSVTWQVNGLAGGSVSIGTISTSGLYTAPGLQPNPNVIAVTAVSAADTTKTASATVTITAGAGLVVSPSAVTLPAGAQQAFAATINNNRVTPVWTLHCGSTAVGACGQIASDGTYTAPLVPPPGGTATVTASTTDNSAVPAIANITIQYSAASVSGQYAFSFAGQGKSGFFANAGSITFDGAGHISGGSVDSPSQGAGAIAITGGTYSVGTDARGTATVQTAAGVETWQFNVVSHSHMNAMRADATGVVASGALDLQNTGQFNLTALRGGYTVSAFGSQYGLVGGFTADGTGILSGGTVDINQSSALRGEFGMSGVLTPPDANGRGTMTLSFDFLGTTGTEAGGQSFAYYVVNAGQVKLVQTDGSLLSSGAFYEQPVSFANSSLQSSFVFTGTGAGRAIGGSLQLSSGAVSSGVMDVAASTFQPNQPVTGSFSVGTATSERATASLSVGGATQNFAVYPRFDGALEFIQTDSGSSVHGTMYPQPAGRFSPSTLNGTYGAVLSADPGSTNDATFVGSFVMRGGTAFSATLNGNVNGTLVGGITLSAGAFAVDGTTGRGTANLTSSNAALDNSTLVVYIVNSNTALVLVGGAQRPMTGILQLQF